MFGLSGIKLQKIQHDSCIICSPVYSISFEISLYEHFTFRNYFQCEYRAPIHIEIECPVRRTDFSIIIQPNHRPGRENQMLFFSLKSYAKSKWIIVFIFLQILWETVLWRITKYVLNYKHRLLDVKIKGNKTVWNHFF